MMFSTFNPLFAPLILAISLGQNIALATLTCPSFKVTAVFWLLEL